MSVKLYVYLPRASMLSPADWQRAMTAAGYPVTDIHDYNPDTHTGFLPCTFDGSPSGFEYSADPLTAAAASAAGAPAGCDWRVTFTTGSDLREYAASAAAASTLCVACDGLLVDPQEGKSYAGASATAWGAEQVEGCRRYLKEHPRHRRR